MLSPLRKDKILIVGLGNPNYSNTYHNVGADLLLQHIQNINAQKIKSNIYQKDNIIFLLCPDYMNVSGPATANVYKKYGCTGMIVLVDELDLKPGELKYYTAMFAKGHNGIRSLLQQNIPFTRILIGIGRPETVLVKDYVLATRTQQYNSTLFTITLQKLTNILHQQLHIS
jgi:PTH1 family peptidyl-tRNA hydrolase